MTVSTQQHWPTVVESIQAYKEDLELQAIDAGIDPPPVAPGSDWDLKAVATCNRFSSAVAGMQSFDEDADPFRATGEPLNDLLRADGLPEVPPAPGRGQISTIVDGTASILAGLKFQASGMKGTVVNTLIDVTGTNAIDVVMDTTGPLTNLAQGTIVRWMNQPANVRTEATVVSRFIGGVGVESDDRKRERLLTSRQNPPGGGNWSQQVLEALNTSGSIAGAFAYPALGGPASVKIALTSNTTASDRTVSQAIIDAVSARYLTKFPAEQALIVVQSALNQSVDVMLGLRLPASGSGIWLAHGPATPIRIITFTSATSFVAQALSGTGAGILAGDTLACWSPTELAFATATVSTVAAAGSPANAWTITTGLWSGADPVNGSYLCPACEGMTDIVAAWLAQMLLLGPGENIASSDSRFEFAYRHPDVTEGAPSELTSRQVGALQTAITDIIRAEYLTGYTPATPAIPATVQDRPAVLRLNQFGVFPI
jgi:hypothetical protein